MQRRYLPIAVLTGVLLLVALAGYLYPAASESSPTRVLLENKGGKVIFTHAAHVDTQADQCVTCHHTTSGSSAPRACTDCHVKQFDAAFAEDHQTSLAEDSCSSCHHPASTTSLFSHEDHANDYTGDCRDCHHDTSIEPDPEACSNCHGKRKEEDVPGLQKAVHTRCADCHEEFFLAGKEGCRHCHVRKSAAETAAPKACSSCHEGPTDQLIPTASRAFHAQCMGCHEKMSSGPFGDDACYQCHMK